MYCKKCGAQIEDDAKFCASCGEQVVQTTKYQKSISESTPIMNSQMFNQKETIVLDIDKSDEQMIINQMNCFCWQLENNQEVSITETHFNATNNGNYSNTSVSISTKTYVKLTFSRLLNYQYFKETDAYYQDYVKKYNDRNNLISESNASKFKAKYFLLIGIIASVIFTILIKHFVFPGNSFLSMPVRDWILSISIGAPIGVGFGLIIEAIRSSVESSRVKKKNAPKIISLAMEMDELAKSSLRFMQSVQM